MFRFQYLLAILFLWKTISTLVLAVVYITSCNRLLSLLTISYLLFQTNVMRTNDKKQTLLQIVLKIVKETKPEILSFQDELTSVCKSQTCELFNAVLVHNLPGNFSEVLDNRY